MPHVLEAHHDGRPLQGDPRVDDGQLVVRDAQGMQAPGAPSLAALPSHPEDPAWTHR